MSLCRRLSLLSLSLVMILGGSAPSWAQSSTTSTPLPEVKATRSLDQLLHPERKKFETYLRDNRSLDLPQIETMRLDQMRIPKIDPRKLDLKKLKRGGVDSGGGDQLGLEFQAALGDAEPDTRLYALNEKPTYDFGDLRRYAATLNIVAVDQPFADDGARIAKNVIATKTILIQRSAWNAIQDRRIKNAVALNQALTMREGKETGYAGEAVLALEGAGLSLLALYNGKASPLSADEQVAVTEHQCLASFISLKRVSVLATQEILTCRYRNEPLRFEIRAAQVDRLLTRCESTCGVSERRSQCVSFHVQYADVIKSARRLVPDCVGGK